MLVNTLVHHLFKSSQPHETDIIIMVVSVF